MAKVKRPHPLEHFFRMLDAEMRANPEQAAPMTPGAFRILADAHEEFGLPAPDWARIVAHKGAGPMLPRSAESA